MNKVRIVYNPQNGEVIRTIVNPKDKTKIPDDLDSLDIEQEKIPERGADEKIEVDIDRQELKVAKDKNYVNYQEQYSKASSVKGKLDIIAKRLGLKEV